MFSVLLSWRMVVVFVAAVVQQLAVHLTFCIFDSCVFGHPYTPNSHYGGSCQQGPLLWLLLLLLRRRIPCPSRCPESGSGFLMGGPIWARPLHDQEWVAGLLQQMEGESERYAQFARLKGILTSVLEELPDVPLYYK